MRYNYDNDLDECWNSIPLWPRNVENSWKSIILKRLRTSKSHFLKRKYLKNKVNNKFLTHLNRIYIVLLSIHINLFYRVHNKIIIYKKYYYYQRNQHFTKQVVLVVVVGSN